MENRLFQLDQSPIQNTPHELLAQIFLFAFPYPRLDREWTCAKDGTAVTTYQRTITSVCSWWREIAMSIRQLWTLIIIDDYCPGDAYLKREYLRSILPLSKGLPLDIRVLWFTDPKIRAPKKIIVDLVTAVNHELPRCITLELQLSQWIPEESLSRLLPSPQFPSSTSLQELKLRIGDRLWKHTGLSISPIMPQSLHTINIHSPTFGLIVPPFDPHFIRSLTIPSFDLPDSDSTTLHDHLWEGFTQLKELSIRDPYSCSLLPQHNEGVRPIKLPKLKILRLGGYFPPALSKNVQAPLLAHFVMLEHSPYARGSMPNIDPPDLPQFETLQIDSALYREKASRCLEQQRSLSAISFDCMSAHVFKLILDLEPGSLPHLRTLRMVYPPDYEEFYWKLNLSSDSERTYSILLNSFTRWPHLFVEMVGEGHKFNLEFNKFKTNLRKIELSGQGKPMHSKRLVCIHPDNAVPLHSWPDSFKS